MLLLELPGIGRGEVGGCGSMPGVGVDEVGGCGSPPVWSGDGGSALCGEIGGSDSVKPDGTLAPIWETGRRGKREPPSAGPDLEIGVSPER